MTQRETYIMDLKNAVASSIADLTIDDFEVLARRNDGLKSQIIIPSVEKNKTLHYVVKSFYMGACRRRDFTGEGNPPLWQGIDIPCRYWPVAGQKRGGGTTPACKPLFKIAVGGQVKEFDKSDSLESLLQKINDWLVPIISDKHNAYHTLERNRSAYDEYASLLKSVKPIAALQIDDTVKVSMILPLLTNSGYRQAERLATHLLDLSTGQATEKDLTLLEKN